MKQNTIPRTCSSVTDTLQQQISSFPSNIGQVFEQFTGKQNSTQNLIEPITQQIIKQSDSSHKLYYQKGLQLLQEGKVGVVLLAGGQGTRLGANIPKGCYKIEGLSRSLFQQQAEQIRRLQRLEATVEARYHDEREVKQAEQSQTQNQSLLTAEPASKVGGNVRRLIHWYIMTSPQTHSDTESFFEENKYFGLLSEQVHFFQQGCLPCFTEQGDYILQSPDTIATAPNGNGGVYCALRDSCMLDHMKKNGIEFIHSYCVDNVLVKVADPIFIACCVAKKVKFGAKYVQKKYPEERVGVFAKRNGALSVIEYYEMEENMQSDSKFNQSNIVNFFYTTNFLEECANYVSQGKLPYHVARKEIDSFDEHGKPTKINGLKLELFNFDICEFVGENFLLFEVERRAEFAPLKNATGSDSPLTCRANLSRHNVKLLKKAGAKVDIDEDSVNDEDMPVCEISPLVTYNGELLENIARGETFTLPLLLESNQHRQKIVKDETLLHA